MYNKHKERLFNDQIQICGHST